MIITEIITRRDLVDLVNEIGFLPFFSGRIEGFSLEENISERYWGDKLCRSAYKRDPEQSLERIIKHISKVLPKMDEEELRALLKA